MKCNYISFPVSKRKNAIEEEIANFSASTPIHFEDILCESYDKAKKILSTTKAEETKAIRYQQSKNFIPSKYLSNLYERYNKAVEEYERSKAKFLDNYRLVYLECPICKSKLAIKFFIESHNNICPVCDNDFRPITTQERTNKKKEVMEDLQKKIKEREDIERAKIENSKETLWLVKYYNK